MILAINHTHIDSSFDIVLLNTLHTSVAYQNWRDVDQRPHGSGKLKKIVPQVKTGLTPPEKVSKSSNNILMLSEHGHLPPQAPM